MSADHAVSPDATPVSPFEVLHLTALIATLSLAVPGTWMNDEVVETMVVAGEVIRRPGGVT